MSLFEGATPGGFPILRSLPWREDYVTALNGARAALLALDDPAFALSGWLARRTPTELAAIADRSTDKSTHYKWRLGGEPNLYAVCLHQYKEPDEFDRSDNFANSVHNHRYGFASIVISGELHTVDFELDAQHDHIEARETRVMACGDTMTISPEAVHRVTRVGKKTQTLLIQGPIVSNYSVRYGIDGGAERIYDLQTLVSTLKSDVL